MRYIKVLLLVLLFFFVMLFFVQNQATFSQALPLKLDLLFIAPLETNPLPFYVMLLICFVIGALVTLLMLIWDRLSISAKLTMANMRARSVERDLAKAQKQLENNENACKELKATVVNLETALNKATQQPVEPTEQA